VCPAPLERQRMTHRYKWRSNVVTKKGPEWVVRTLSPLREPRPAGVPDCVSVVVPTPDAAHGLRIE